MSSGGGARLVERRVQADSVDGRNGRDRDRGFGEAHERGDPGKSRAAHALHSGLWIAEAEEFHQSATDRVSLARKVAARLAGALSLERESDLTRAWARASSARA